MAKVEEIYGPLKTLEEKQAFIEAQHKTINQLTEQIRELEEKNRQLEQMVVSNVPVLTNPGSNGTGVYGSEEELIAREQLKMFALIATEREFTLEETRKVDIYAKLLIAVKQQKEKPKSSTEGMSPAQLLKLVEEQP